MGKRYKNVRHAHVFDSLLADQSQLLNLLVTKGRQCVRTHASCVRKKSLDRTFSAGLRKGGTKWCSNASVDVQFSHLS